MFLLFLLLSFLKLLFIPAYKSTDFEVHRNWLAITHSLPLKKWYFEDTSESTLDYPPFFAYFECVLSFFAKFFDPKMLVVTNLNYDSTETIIFQRISVIVTDIVFYIGARQCIKSIPDKFKNCIWILLLGNIGLLFVDHIHFQYNGLLFGILLLSIGKMVRGNFLQASLYFAVLLNMKHIFMYMAPVYFFYLLKYYCFKKDKELRLIKLAKVGAIVITIFIASFGPFYDHLPQVFSRLFPFKRGLSHAYWAPNFWALYNFADKILSLIKKSNTYSSNTRGLVQSFDHVELPTIQPIITFFITAVAMIPCLIKICFQSADSNLKSFVKPLVICATTSFMFGWHVHEKAILMSIIPLVLIAWENEKNARMFVFLTTVGHYSLFPLLFPESLLFIKLSMYLVYLSLTLKYFRNIAKFSLIEKLYLFGLVLLFLFEHLIQNIMGIDRNLPFLALMLTSVYCALGISYFWVRFYIDYLWEREKSKNNVKKKK